MELTFTQKKSIRKSFGKLKEGLSIPNLIEVQKNSYQEFLSSKAFNEQMDVLSKADPFNTSALDSMNCL